MDTLLVLNILFSILMLPLNLYCSFWIFNNTLNSLGVTFKEFLGHFAGQAPLPDTNDKLGRNQRRIFKYLASKSSNPSKIAKSLYAYGICTLPGLAALTLAEYASLSSNPNKLKYAFIGNIVLLIINIALLFIGKIYKQNHPLDEATAQIISEKRANEKDEDRKYKIKNIIVYTLAGAFFISVIMIFNLAAGNVAGFELPQYQNTQPSAVTDYYDVHDVLDERNFETANISTTYWEFDEEKLIHVISGIKEDVYFEYYEYTNNETVDSVYSRICYDISQDMEDSERTKHETELSGGGKMFTITEDGIYTAVLYEDNTVVYAHSPEKSTEINDILAELGYIKN